MQNNFSSLSRDTIPSVAEIIGILARHKKLMLQIFSSTALLGLIVIALIPNSYRATATVILNDHNINLDNFEDITGGAKFDDMSVQTEGKIIDSEAVGLEAIKKIDLDKTPQFKTSSGKMREVLDHYMKNLTVDVQATSRAIDVSFKAHDPELAAKVVNAVTAAYLELRVELKRKQVARLNEWFESKIQDLKADAAKKAKAVEDFRAKENLTLGLDDKQLIYEQISDVAGELVPVQVHKYNVQGKLTALNTALSSGKPDALDDVVKSPLIQNLKTQAGMAMQQVESLKATYGPKHPLVIQAQGELDGANRAIKAEVDNVKNSLQNDEEATEKQEALLKDRLDMLNKQADGLREKLVGLNSLEAEAEASKQILSNFLNNYQDTQTQLNFSQTDADVVSAATPPASPILSKGLLSMVALVFAGCLAISVVFALELMKGGLRNFDDIRRLAQKPLGIIPYVTNPIQTMLLADNSTYREALKRIYMTGLLNHPARTILVTSALPKEGRTTFAASMGHYLLSLGLRVIVIDADFLHPSLSRLTDLPGGPGLTDVLSDHVALAEAIDRDEHGLSILRAGNYALASPNVLRASRLHALLDQLKRDYDYILVDSGPLLAHSEAGVIANEADGIIVVIEWLKTSQQNIANMFATLRNFPTSVLGVVINKVDIDKYKNISTGSDFLLPGSTVVRNDMTNRPYLQFMHKIMEGIEGME